MTHSREDTKLDLLYVPSQYSLVLHWVDTIALKTPTYNLAAIPFSGASAQTGHHIAGLYLKSELSHEGSEMAEALSVTVTRSQSGGLR